MKILLHTLAILILIAGWTMFLLKTGSDESKLTPEQRAEMVDRGEDFRAAEIQRASGGESVINGILMAFLTAGYLGVMFVVYVLPSIAHKFTHAVYDSGEMVETDLMHDARALVAQGEYDDAIKAFEEAAKIDPTNRLPWVEIVKIQHGTLEDTDAAIATLRHVLEHNVWEQRDAAYFLFRLAEIYDEDKEDRMSAAQILQQVMDQFPETRHSANARHKLHEWGLV